MRCPKCNHTIEDDALFCTECGCNISEFEQEETVSGKVSGAAGEKRNGKFKRREKISVKALISFLTICLILFAAGAGYWFLTYDREPVTEWVQEQTVKINEEEQQKRMNEIDEMIGDDESEEEEQVTEPATDSQLYDPALVVRPTHGNEEDDTMQEYILPDSSTRRLSDSEVQGLSQEELRLARNEIYARHGRLFDDAQLQNYFNAKSWYSGTVSPENFSEEMLSDIEKANIDLIKKYEQ